MSQLYLGMGLGFPQLLGDWLVGNGSSWSYLPEAPRVGQNPLFLRKSGLRVSVSRIICGAELVRLVDLSQNWKGYCKALLHMAFYCYPGLVAIHKTGKQRAGWAGSWEGERCINASFSLVENVLFRFLSHVPQCFLVGLQKWARATLLSELALTCLRCQPSVNSSNIPSQSGQQSQVSSKVSEIQSLRNETVRECLPDNWDWIIPAQNVSIVYFV